MMRRSIFAATSGGRLVNPAARVRARSRDTGEVLPPGEVGGLEIGSDTLFRGYFRDPEATRAAFTEDGYFRTGDLGFTRADGTFRFLGRAGDFLRLGGFLVNPLEIEQVLQQDAAIETAVVVEVATERGNKPVAFVRLRSGHAFDENVMRDRLKTVMADFKNSGVLHRGDDVPRCAGTERREDSAPEIEGHGDRCNRCNGLAPQLRESSFLAMRSPTPPPPSPAARSPG